MDMLEVFEDLTSVIKTTHRMTAKQALETVTSKFVNQTLDQSSDANDGDATKDKTYNLISADGKSKTLNVIRLTDIGSLLLPEEADV